MRSANIFLLAVVFCGGSLLLSCKKHEPSASNQPKNDVVTAVQSAPAAPAATPQATPSPEPAKTPVPESKAAAPAEYKPVNKPPAASAKPTPAVPASVVLLPDKNNEEAEKGGNLDRFAKCLAQKQLTMYGHYLCPHCAEQKGKFGDSFHYVHYVECGVFGEPMTVQNQTCKDMQIKRYPTWIMADGERIESVQTMEQLSQKSGCRLP
jgi:hypothetical protein